MKIKTKEQYNKVKSPLIPKSRRIKKARIKIKETFRLHQPIPFIPEKDRTHKPFPTSGFRRRITLFDLFSAYGMPGFVHGHYYPTSSISGRIKHAGEVRSIKKIQRRRTYLRSL